MGKSSPSPASPTAPVAMILPLHIRANYFRSFVAVCLLISGCTSAEDATYEVRGLVRFTDGQLLRHGTVEFESMDREKPITARGEIQPDGTFELGTFELTDGAVKGRHRVVVIADQNEASQHERPWLLPKILLHPKYRDFSTSGLVYEVKAESNHFVINVEYAEQD